MRDRPIYAHYAVTHRCNLRCRSCTIWKNGSAASELTVDAARQLAAVLARLGCIQVSLGGGEPTMRPDLPGIVQAFQSVGIRPRVLTNGVGLEPDLIDRLVGIGVREISFSLNSLRAELQEELDEVPGTFDRRMRHLFLLAERLPRRGVLPVLNIVVTPRNVGELDALLDLAGRIGFFASFIPVHLAAGGERGHRAYGCDADLRFVPEERPEIRAAYGRLIAGKRRGAPILNSTAFLERSAEYLAAGRTDWPCRAGRLYLSVAPDGRIGACHAFEGTQDVPFREFADRYRSAAFRRELARAHERCEGCFRPCWAEVSYMMTDPRSFLEMARVQARVRLGRRPLDLDAARSLLERRREAAS